jgi:hypothetical protein
MEEARSPDILAENVTYAGITSGCPPYPPPGVVHSFSTEELTLCAGMEGNRLIVHRGKQVDLPGFRLIHCHTEIAMIFSSRAGSSEYVSLDQVIDCLTGRSGNSRRRGGWRILQHGGSLNKRALQFVVSQCGGGDLSNEETHCFHSYRELATAGIGIPGALVIGLRGKEAIRPQLHPVLVDGWDPQDPITRGLYPLQSDVHVYVKDNEFGVSRSSALEYLHMIRQRIAVDALRLFNTDDHAWARSRASLAA